MFSKLIRKDQLAQKNLEWYLEQVGHTIIHPRLIGEHISDGSMPLKHRETHNSIRKRASLTQKSSGAF